MVKNSSAIQETWFDLWVGKIPWGSEWLPTPVFLPGKFSGQKSLARFSPWDHKELDMTERLSTTHRILQVKSCQNSVFES